MRRAVLFSVVVVAAPLLLLAAFTGTGKAGPSSQLVSSWVDSDGTAHLQFDVRHVTSGAALTAALVLHRQTNAPASAVRISAAGSAWSKTVGWPSNTPSSAIEVDVSAVVHGNGPADFLVSDITPASSPDVVVSPTAGPAAPALLLKTSSGSSTTVAAAQNTVAGRSVSASAPSDAASWTPVGSGSTTSSPAGQPGRSWQSLWVVLAPPPPGSGSNDWVPTDSNSNCSLSPILVPSCGVWWGIGANPTAGQSWDQAMADFDTLQGRASDLLHYYHVGSALFPTQVEIDRAQANGDNRVLLENWKPELGRSWAQVAAGDPAVDAEIDREAAYLKSSYTKQFFLAIHHEPENEVVPAAGSGFTASDYAAMYRHVVLRLRADGVTNAVYVVDYMGAPKWGEQPWFKDLYPGDDVVDWIAEDPYSVGSGGVWRADFAGMVDRRDGSSWPGFYTWATTTHPGKPIMLAEWGVTEDPANPAAKATFFSGMVAELQQFPAIKALVYWNAPGSNASTGTAIDSDPAALAAFRLVARSAEFQVSGP